MTINQSALKKFAQKARRDLKAQVANRLDQVLRTDSVELREREAAIRELNQQIAQNGKQQVIDRVAYTWFNRFCALRYMDVNAYTMAGILSPAHGESQPEVLRLAKSGQLPQDLLPSLDLIKVRDLLNDSQPSSDPQGEAYRLLVVAACNHYNDALPFLFQKIDDYTELLMPRDLLSANSILADVRAALDKDTCRDVEVIGWLYQYYISERKDEIFADLKSNKKIEQEDIPAATQLFTPHWIVRYLVENSLGRLWLLNHPNSDLALNMPYYIKPPQAVEDFLKVNQPADLKVLDPACGSGHMLTYAFDLLHAIYDEQGFSPSEIASSILSNNLTGVEIDERAGALASFALMMKARELDKRFFTRGVTPKVVVLKNISFSPSELTAYRKVIGANVLTPNVMETLEQFQDAKTFGSLIRPRETNAGAVRQRLASRPAVRDLTLTGTHNKAVLALTQAEVLNQRYHVVIANPPYMGSKGMNGDLKAFAERNYPDSKSDLFAMFIERGFDLALPKAYSALVTMQSWMFLSSYEKLRKGLIKDNSIVTLAQLGARAFDSIGGEVVQTTAFVSRNGAAAHSMGDYLRLVDGVSETDKARMLTEAIANPECGWFFRADAAEFSKIPGAPIAYWVHQELTSMLNKFPSLGDSAEIVKGLDTCDNERFLRLWHEVSWNKFSKSNHHQKIIKWFPYSKGGGFRKWYGNWQYVVNWENSGSEICNYRNPDGSLKSRPQNVEKYFKTGITFSSISSSIFSARYMSDSIFGGGGSGLFIKDPVPVLAMMNSPIAKNLIELFNPTLNFTVSDIQRLPNTKYTDELVQTTKALIDLHKIDWDSSEASWDFESIAAFPAGSRLLKEKYVSFCQTGQRTFTTIKQLEESNSHHLLLTYGIEKAIQPVIPLEQITLTCNPVYRYGAGKTEEEYAALQKADTMKELISYAVGCMFGRYSLNKPGLILANQGETLQDYLRQIPDPTFTPDEDNVLPILDNDWFNDDITERFKQFLKVSFGEAHYNQNLAFIEEAIGKDIRSYFVKDFYTHHLKMYKKRPIYWLFSSPKGGFRALIYLHRYNRDTVSVVLNKYLRAYNHKLTARRSFLKGVADNALSTQTQKTAAIKELEKLEKTQKESTEYEHEVLFPLATQSLEIDLDDGVKVNYLKFGNALAKIPGLEKKE